MRRNYIAISYDRIQKLLIYKKMSKTNLQKAAEIAPNTMTKLSRNEAVNLAKLGKMYKVLDCDFGEIIEYVKEIGDV